MAHISETQRTRSFASSGGGHAGAGLLRRTRLLLGYSFFEDQFPKEKPAERFAYYEDQMAAATAKNMEPKPQKSEHERLVELHDWKKTDKELNIPENFGWAEEWGPEPGEEGHNDWYKKERQYMSEEEKLKFDIGLGVPLKSKHIRHQELPYHRKVAASYYNLNEDKPYHYTTKDKNVDAPYTPQEKSDYMGSARRDFLEEWLAKPGVNPENVGMKVAEYNGTAKNHAVKKLPRKPDWELAPQTDDDE